MKATNVFIIFALALVSKLALVECLRDAPLVTDGTAEPQPYMAQIRSIQGGVRKNSTGCIINTRWVMGVAPSIFALPSGTFVYLGSLIFNGLGNVRSIIVIKIERSLALLKTNSSITYSTTIKAAPMPILGQNYGLQTAIVSGYGGDSDTSPYSSRRVASNLLIDYNVNHPTTSIPDTMILLKNTSTSCIDMTDAGSVVWAGINGTNSIVALVLNAVGNLSCQANPTNSQTSCLRLTKYYTFISNSTADLS